MMTRSSNVDQQRTTPLGILRSAYREPTAHLAFGIVPVQRDPFDIQLPDDIYGSLPQGAWSDLGDEVQQAGNHPASRKHSYICKLANTIAPVLNLPTNWDG